MTPTSRHSGAISLISRRFWVCRSSGFISRALLDVFRQRITAFWVSDGCAADMISHLPPTSRQELTAEEEAAILSLLPPAQAATSDNGRNQDIRIRERLILDAACGVNAWDISVAQSELDYAEEDEEDGMWTACVSIGEFDVLTATCLPLSPTLTATCLLPLVDADPVWATRAQWSG